MIKENILSGLCHLEGTCWYASGGQWNRQRFQDKITSSVLLVRLCQLSEKLVIRGLSLKGAFVFSTFAVLLMLETYCSNSRSPVSQISRSVTEGILHSHDRSEILFLPHPSYHLTTKVFAFLG